MAIDMLIKNARVVRPGSQDVLQADIAIKDGVFIDINPNLPSEDAKEVIDAKNRLAFPGLVDAHMHVGI